MTLSPQVGVTGPEDVVLDGGGSGDAPGHLASAHGHAGCPCST